MNAYKRQCGEGEGYRGGVEAITIEAPVGWNLVGRIELTQVRLSIGISGSSP